MKDLGIILKKKSPYTPPNGGIKFIDNRELLEDHHIATNIVSLIFEYVNSCISGDKSKVKLNILTKSFIKSVLTEGTKNGINNFITNMNDENVKFLLDDIQRELDKRK